MNLSNTFTREGSKSSSEIMFFLETTKSALFQSSAFRFLKKKEEIRSSLMAKLLEFKRPTIFTASTHQFTDMLNTYVSQLQRVLTLPSTDPHVIFLACLKWLKDNNVYDIYDDVLKDILANNLHRIAGVSMPFPFIGREKEIVAISRIVHSTERNNVLIVGAPGVGKTSTALAVLARIQTHTCYRLFPTSESLADQILTIHSETDTKKNLFFLDELFQFDSRHIAAILTNAQLLGTASTSAWQKFRAEFPTLVSKMQIIELDEPPVEEINTILTQHQIRISERSGIQWEADMIEALVNVSKQFVHDPGFPAKGINILEESAQIALTQHRAIATITDMKMVISQKTNIPLTHIAKTDEKDLASLEEKLAHHVKGQDDAIRKVSQTIIRSHMNLTQRDKPIGSFLFIGPSGVGKTELAKAIAREIFGDEQAMIRLDMSEFSEAHMAQRLIGAPPGYIGFEDGGQLTNPVKLKPYRLILIDEIEKAHSKVFDLFLQVLDEGRLTDGQGNTVDFRHTIVVATSNAGLEDMLDLLDQGANSEAIESQLKESLNDYFRPEFLNRFDHIIIFRPLSIAARIEIARLYFSRIIRELKKRDISLIIREETIRSIATESASHREGARGLIRSIQDGVETQIAQLILTKKLSDGQHIEV